MKGAYFHGHTTYDDVAKHLDGFDLTEKEKRKVFEIFEAGWPYLGRGFAATILPAIARAFETARLQKDKAA